MRSWGTEAWASWFQFWGFHPLLWWLPLAQWERRRAGGLPYIPPLPSTTTGYRAKTRDSLSSCVIWVSWPCFFKLLYVFVSLPKTMLLIFTMLDCEGGRLFRKSLASNRGTQIRHYYLFEMSYKAQVHVCMGRGMGVTLLVTLTSHHIWPSMIFYWRRSTWIWSRSTLVMKWGHEIDRSRLVKKFFAFVQHWLH